MQQQSIKKLFFIVGFITFSGYYLLLAIISDLGFQEFSRMVTVPLKILLMLIMLFFIIKLKEPTNSKYTIFEILVFSFMLFYLFRTLYDTTLSPHARDLSMLPYNYILYFVSSAVIPFLYFRKIVFYNIKNHYYGIMVGTILLMLFVIFFYDSTNFDARLGTTESKGFELSPLSVSYTSIISIGVGLGNILLLNKSKWLNILMIIISIPAFLIGSSKGSFVALLVSILYIFFFNHSISFFKKIIFLITISFSIIFFINSDLLLAKRMLNTSEHLKEGRKEARQILWNHAIENTINNPFIGDFIEDRNVPFLNGKTFHPHNVVIEAFMATGLLFGSFFLLIVLLGFKYSYNVVQYDKTLFWIPLLYIQTIIQNLFSGSLWASLWLWSSLGLVFGVDRIFFRKKI